MATAPATAAAPAPSRTGAEAKPAEAPAPAANAGTAKAKIQITVTGPNPPAAGDGAEAEKKKGADGDTDGEDQEPFLQGAHLETSFEADRLLRRARDFVDADPPQFRKAAIILQHVIREDANVLATADGRTYHPVREIAERTIIAMGPEGLEAYRTEVDGQVKALLAPAGAERNDEVLHAVESRFFLSSRGDEAAFALGCLYLDRHEYARARRLLSRLADLHPDPSMARGQVLLRLALACHRSGDVKGARAAWARLETLDAPGVPAEALAAVRDEVAAPVPRSAARPSTLRTACLRPSTALPAEHMQGPRSLWVPVWQRPLDILPTGIPGRYLGVNSRTDETDVMQRLREQLGGQWQQSTWVPAGSVLIDGENVLVKSNATLLCLDAATGDRRWETRAPEEPEQKATGFSVHARVTTSSRPRSPLDILAFADEISKAVSVLGDTVYHIEDHAADQWTHRRPRVVIRIVNGKQVRTEGEDPLTGNRLAAYDRGTGKRRWRIGRTKDESDPWCGLRFLAAPAACGDRLLVPVESGGELALAALDPADGSIRWRTFLCSFSTGQRRLWDEIGLLADGGDVYVATGEGVVFSLDGVDGTIHWATRYERSLDERSRSSTAQATAGWRANRLFLKGRRLLVLPVDAEAALLFDARTGRPLARHPTAGVSRCLGAAGDRLWAAGPDRARCLDVASGRTVWDVPLGGGARGYGRGFVAHDAVYVPVEETLLRLDRATGRRLGVLAVMTPDDVPVGNVTTDGRHLFVLGPGRVYALAASSERLAQIEGTLKDSAEALAEAVEALSDAERRAAAAERTAAARVEAVSKAAGIVKALQEKAKGLEQARAEVDEELTALREQQASLPAETAEGPGEADALAAYVAEQIAETVRRRQELAAEGEDVASRIADARKGHEQLVTKHADAKAKAADLEKRRDARRKAADAARRRHLTACLAKAAIERSHAWYDRAASTYRAALDAAGQSRFREQARRGLFEVFLAKADASEGTAARETLAEARQVAQGSAETLRIHQAVAETYEREGRPERALAAYLDIAADGADALVTVDAGHATWQVSPAGAAAEGVRSLRAKHGEALAPAVRRHAAAALEQARGQKSVHHLRTVLRTFPGAEEAVRAGLKAAALAEADGRFEVAELILHEMLRSRHAPTRGAALARLARMHQEAGWTAQARGEWHRLAEEFAKTEIEFQGEPRAAGALARRRLEDLGVPAPAPAPTLPPPPWRRLWKVEGQHLNLLLPPAAELRDFGQAGASQFLLQHALVWMLSPSRGLACHRLRDGKAVYTCDLSNRSVSFGRSKPREGHVVVARSSQEVSAVGLVSGEVLWTRKEPVRSNRSGIFQAHLFMHMMHRAMFRGLWGTGQAATGTVVFCPEPQTVRALDLATGRVLWERTFRRQRFSGIQEAGGLVCLIMDGGAALRLCDAVTGADRGTIPLDLGQVHAWALLMVGDGFIAQPRDPKTGMFRLAYRDLPSGRQRWSIEPSPLPKVVYPLTPETVCLVEQGRNLEIRDLATGALRGRCEPDVPILPHMADVCLGPTGRFLYVVSRQGMESGLAVVDLEGGDTRAYDFGENQAGRPLPAELYAAAGEYLPYVERVQGSRRYRVRFLRRSDGQPADDMTLPSSEEDGTFEHLSTLVCRDGVLLVVTNRSIEAFGHDAPGGQLVAE
ncbi:MAG: PQQ-binding-like beta-propeller repeat protein [Phycisphaerae bacterium]